jgi:hypothetical protein
MAILTQKTLAQTPRETLSLLYLLGEIGGRHELLLIHRDRGGVASVANLDAEEIEYFVQGMAERAGGEVRRYSDLEPNTPTQRIRAEWAISSSRMLMVNLIEEKTTLQRYADQRWTITNHAHANPISVDDVEPSGTSGGGSTTAIVSAAPCAIA